MAQTKEISIELLKGRPYQPSAYRFVLRALEFTIARLERRRHVTGPELLAGIRDMAKDRYGPMAADVFRSWGVRTTFDFGEIVFDLVEWGVLRKRDEDSKEDFRDCFEFDTTFEKDYNFLCDFRVVRGSRFPHLIPVERPAGGKSEEPGQTSLTSKIIL